MHNKNKSNIMIQNKTRQQAKKHLETRSKHNKTKAITRNIKRNRKEGRKKLTRERERERERQRERKRGTKMPFLGGGRNKVFLLKAKKGKQSKSTQKKQRNKEGLGPSEVALWATSPDP